jgi:hypothetical protein
MISGANPRIRAYVLESSGDLLRGTMPHRRKAEKGSFGAHFDELIVHFPANERPTSSEKGSAQRPRELQDKVDIHSALFRRAWKLDGES